MYLMRINYTSLRHASTVCIARPNLSLVHEQPRPRKGNIARLCVGANRIAIVAADACKARAAAGSWGSAPTS